MAQQRTIDHVVHELEGQGVRRVRLGGFDIDGVLRGKYVTLDKFASAARHGMGFCDVIFGWDSQDALYEDVGVQLTGWHTGYPDLVAWPDLASMRRVPWDRDIPFFLLDFFGAEGRPFPASPRQLLRHVEGRASSMGFRPLFAAEFEFFLFTEDSRSAREKGWHNLQPLSPGMFGYSILRASTYGDLVHGLVDALDAFDVPVEGIHTETGPGVYEAALVYDDVVSAADKAALFKAAAKEILVRKGVMATFMAKVSGSLPGCSGHTHQSLWRDGEPVFHDASDPDGMSATFRSYVAGVQALLPELAALYCPTVNSYRRLVPGLWAPTSATWGFENRTAALRVIRSASGKATRVENRVVGADMCAHLAFAASLASGLWGIERGLELGPPVSGNAYAAGVDGSPMPRTLEEATDRLDASTVARELLGAEFVDHFVATRRWEVEQSRKAVTDWELARYFEII